MWCHLLLAAPVVGLSLFFVLPFGTALTLYLIIVALSLLLYYQIMESMRAPVLTGPEGLVGQIVLTDGSGTIHMNGEWWTAIPPLPNQQVRIVALHGLVVEIEAADTAEAGPICPPRP